MGDCDGDLGFSKGGDQDATMTDAGEKGRPPDIPESWVRKVAGSKEGGRLVPESVLDEGFVEERMKLVFPDGEDGEPVVTIGEEVLEAMNGLWKQCMIVKVLGRNISILNLNRKLKEMWKPQGAMYVVDLPRQCFLIRFEKEDEYMAALTGGPWRAFGSYLMVQAWSPDFDSSKDEIVTTPVWVRLSSLPVNFYHTSILMGIAKGLGKPLKVDFTTSNLERGRFARECVEVNLTKPLKGTILINGQRYYVSYEGLNTICSSCGLYGHATHACPKMVKEQAVDSQAKPVEASGGNSSLVAVEEGFTPVRQRGRKAVSQRDRQGVSGGGHSGRSGVKARDSRGVELAIILIANSFGRLEADLEGLEIQGADKENTNQLPTHHQMSH